MPPNINCFQNIAQRINLIETLATPRKVRLVTDFYNLETKNIDKKEFEHITNRTALQQNLINLFPEHEELLWIWKFQRVPKNYWKNIDNQTIFLKQFEKENQINSKNDWYQMTAKEFRKTARPLYREYNSIQKLLRCVYPDFDWKSWKFAMTEPNYWNKFENKQQFVNDIEEELNVKELEDWYQVSSRKLKKYASTLIQQEGGLLKLLQTVYPNFSWQPWKFSTVAQGTWLGNLGKYRKRQLLDSKALKLNVISQNQWLSIGKDDIFEESRVYVLRNYRGSLINALIDLYPEVEWLPWNFSKIPRNFWENDKNTIQFLNYCKKIFNIENISDWNNVSYDSMRNIGGSALLKKFGGINHILNHFFKQELTTNNSILSIGKTQRLIYSFLQKIFPEKKIISDFKHPNLFFENTNRKIEFDIYLPSFGLAFEYQGQQHFEFTNLGRDPKFLKIEDNEKREICKKNFISLIEIPYWSEISEENLKNIISENRPDIKF